MWRKGVEGVVRDRFEHEAPTFGGCVAREHERLAAPEPPLGTVPGVEVRDPVRNFFLEPSLEPAAPAALEATMVSGVDDSSHEGPRAGQDRGCEAQLAQQRLKLSAGSVSFAAEAAQELQEL